MSAANHDELRVIAEPAFQDGICSLIRVYNMLNDPGHAWQFSPVVHKRVEELIKELMGVFWDGEIYANPKAAALSRARNDEVFRRFMKQATGRRRRSSKAKQ